MKLFHNACWVGLIGVAAFAADPDGAAIYKQQCALCHDHSAQTRAPAPVALHAMSVTTIVRALESGLMKQQGASLDAAQKRAVAEFLAGPSGEPTAESGMCENTKAPFSPAGKNWNGWGVDLANTRFQSADAAQLSASNVPKLKLKWAFAFKGTSIAYGQPSVIGGRVFVASANRHIYSLDARTGCQYWSFEAAASVRTAITIATLSGTPQRHVAFFGDQRATAYGVDASNGELLWKTHIDDHVNAKIVGAPVYYDGRLIVPLTAGEEGPQNNPKYECCTARGGLVSLDAVTGKQIWKTYTIDDLPKETGKNWAGTKTWGPAGASIWSAPTIDTERKLVYAATGDNFSAPATSTSDAVIAFDLATGRKVWVRQLTEGDIFNMGCMDAKKVGCPETNGPDFDFGSSPVLVKLASGKRVLIAGQKSGVVHALDPDREGAIVWQTRIGAGSALGGIQWGSATDGKNVYSAVSDIAFLPPAADTTRPVMRQLVANPKAGGGLFALDLATGKKVWSTPGHDCGDRPFCSPAQSAAVSLIPGVVFSGSLDGHLRAYATEDGKVIWDFDSEREYTAVNGGSFKGGSMDGPGPTIAGGMLFVSSGYGIFGGRPGNVLLAFSAE